MSKLFVLSENWQSILRIMILIPKLVFWISNPKFIFWEICLKKSKLFALFKNWYTHTHTHRHTHTHAHTHTHTGYLEDSDSYSGISFLKLQTYIHFLGKFESKKLNSPLYPEAGTQSILRIWL